MKHWKLEFQEIFEQLLWLFDVEPDALAIRRALAHSLSPEALESQQDWREALQLVARQLSSLRFRPLAMSLEEVRAQPSLPPLLLHIPGVQEGESRWVGLLRQERNRYWVTRFVPTQEPSWLTLEELAQLLPGGLGATQHWLMAELAQPLQSWVPEEEMQPLAAAATVWPRLWGLMRSESKELWVLLIYAVVVGIFSLTTPIAVQALVNSVAFGTLLQPLVVLSLMLSAGLSFLAVMQGMQIYLAEMIQRRVFVRVAADFSHRLPRLKLSTLRKYDRSELANYFFDVLTVQKVSAVLLFDGLTSVLTICSGMLLLAIYHPILLAFDLLLIGAILLVIYVFGRGAIVSSIYKSKSKHRAAVWLGRLMEKSLTFKSYQGEQFAQDHAAILTRDYLKARERHFRILMRQIGAGLAIQVLASTLLLLVGGWLVISQQLTLGQLVAAELIVSLVVASLFKLVKSFEKVYALLASLDKIGKIIDLPLERTNGLPIPPGSAPLSLTCEDLCFQTSTGHTLFTDLNLSIAAGSRICISGPAGSGKSCLADLFFGLCQPQRGQLLIGEHALRDIHLQDLRRVLSLVREVEVFDGTVWDNVRLGRTDIGLRDARRALERVGLLSQIQALPDGLNTVLTACGAPLSSQQQALLVIARAMAAKPNVLFIDGVLDGLEAPQLSGVLQALTDRNAPWTLVLISNHPLVQQACELNFTMPTGAPSLPGPASGLAFSPVTGA